MRTWLAAGLIVFATFLTASQPISRFVTLEPDTGKKGDTVIGKGENLSKAMVAEVLLSDGRKDTIATICEQSDSEIDFMIPDVTPGRYRVLLLTADHAAIVEQPVVVNVQ